MTRWLTRNDALAELRIRPQTLYAYVSRGRIERRPDPADPRRSLYRAADVEGLVGRRERGKRPAAIAASTIAWGEPIISTAISTVERGRLLYRGKDAAALADKATVEETAQLLWGTSEVPAFVATDGVPTSRGSPKRRAFTLLAGAAATGLPTYGRAASVLQAEAPRLMGTLARALGARPAGGVPLHVSLAEAWGGGAGAADLLRRALVLRADQELNTSTFAARVAASTGASLGSCMLAGLAALSGPLHGDATDRIRAVMEEVARSSVDRTVERHLSSGTILPGFGHPLYPDGDPRARALLDALDPPGPFDAIIRTMLSATGQKPNLDFAVFALVSKFELPADASFSLFALARSIGWIAHSIEQATQGELIRPRGRYIGSSLERRRLSGSGTPGVGSIDWPDAD